MKSLRSLIGVVLAFALAALAMPAFAQNQKLYKLEMSPQPTVAAGQPITAKFTNVSPQGNSTFNSLQLVVPSDYKVTRVLSVTRSDGPFTGIVTPPLLASVPEGVNLVKIEGMSAVTKNVNVQITFEATVPITCTSARWNPNLTGDVWNGSQIGSGQSFTLVESASVPNTSTARTDEIKFVSVPASIANAAFDVTAVFDVSVEHTKGCTGTADAPVVITLTADPSTGFTSGTKNQSTTVGLVTAATFTGAKYASSSPATSIVLTTTGGSASASTAAIPVYADGDVACNESVPLSITNGVTNNVANPFDSAEPGQAKSERQLWNSNAATCVKIPYDFTNTLGTDGKVSLIWPSATTDSQKAAIFRNTVTGKLRNLTSSAVPTPPGFQFGWAKKTNGDVIYADALMCLDEEAPRPYASLVSVSADPVIVGTQLTVKWDTAVKPVAPGTSTADDNGWKPIPTTGNFEFTIGDERFEGKVVTGTESTSSTEKTVKIEVVKRNVGFTPSTTSFPEGAFLLSVVMPIYPTPDPLPTTLPDSSIYYGKPVRMCVIAGGIRMYIPTAGADATDTLPATLPTPRYFQYLEYFDGDGWGVER